MALTDLALKRLKADKDQPMNKIKRVSDGNGLQAWIRHTGAISWGVVYRWNGQKQEITIGKYPYMTLSMARAENIRIKELLAQGINPKDERKQTKDKQKQRNTFDYFANLWLANQKTQLQPKTFLREQNQYLYHIKPIIGDMDINSINIGDIMQISDRLKADGKLDTAKRCVRRIGAIYDFNIVKGNTPPNTINPVPRGIGAFVGKHTKEKRPRIKITELPKLLADIDADNMEIMTHHAFYVMCYTFVRTTELFKMRWAEIDFINNLWHIPAERMKMKRPHIVPLAPQVISILQTIKSYGFSREYVFYSHQSKTGILSENALTQALHRMGYKGKMTGHGFRGLASTALNQMQYPHKAIELQLAHADGNEVEKAYNEADQLPIRIKMMNDWANIVDEIKNGNFETYNRRTTTDLGIAEIEKLFQTMGKTNSEITDAITAHRLQ